MGEIVVVGDVEFLSEIVAYQLEADGHAITRCRDGAELVNYLKSDQADVIVIDYSKPEHMGPHTLSQIRSHPMLSGIPVIMMLSRRNPDDILAALRAGATDYMTKPFLPAELSARVAGVLPAQRIRSRLSVKGGLMPLH